MRCISCGGDFHSPAGDIVPVCSFCLAGELDAGRGEARAESTGASPLASCSTASASDMDLLQSSFPDYEILEKIGEGGMGQVFKARQLTLDRFVAIKVLNPPLQREGETRERFEREAKAMAKLNHPNIVGVYDFGERGGWLYIVMEFVDGGDLGVRLHSGGIDRAHALSIIENICEALHYAHGRGVIHRDIKPGNILIDENGLAKVGDFGLAWVAHDSADLSLTQSNVGMGTIGYVAPEQADDARKIDARADIYALGVLIYVMFNGHLPTGNFPPPTSKFPRPSKQLDDVILSAMSTDRETRCGDVREILRVLRNERQREGMASGEISNPAGQTRETQLVILAFALLTALAAIGWWVAGRKSHETGRIEGEVPESRSASGIEPGEPEVELLYPTRGLEGAAKFEAMRKRGGVLRRWSELPGQIDISSAEGYDDLVSVSKAQGFAMSWYAARRDGEIVSYEPKYDGRSDFRRAVQSFHIEWPDRLVSEPPSSRYFIPMAEPVDRAIDLEQHKNTGYILTSDGRVVVSSDSNWSRTNKNLVETLASLNDVQDIDVFLTTFVALRASGDVVAYYEGRGFFPPPDGTGPFIQAAAGMFHVVGLEPSGKVVVWAHPTLAKRRPRTEACLAIPDGLEPAIRVLAYDFVVAVQHGDGTWTAWGDDQGRGIIDHINSVGVSLDFAFFYINPTTGAKCVWIEPVDMEEVASKE